MSVSLARRLLEETDISPDVVQRGLRESLRAQCSLLEALLRQAPELLGRLERFLGSAPVEVGVCPDRGLLAEFPPGLAERLLAFPTRVLPNGDLEVCAADPSDPHVVAELSAHQPRRVQVRAAPLGWVLAAAGVRASPAPGSERPLVRVSGSLPPSSDIAIPLVRRTDRPVRGKVDTTPGLGRGPTPLRGDRASAKAVPSTRRTDVGMPSQPPKVARPERPPRPTPAEVEGRLVAASSPDAIAGVIAWALGAGTLVFAVRSEVFVLRAAAREAPGLEDGLSIPRGGSYVLERALGDGEYQGPVVAGEEDDALCPWLEGGEQVYASPVLVQGRPVLVFVAPTCEDPLALARYGQRLAGAAGKAIELLIVRRKRSLHP